MSLSHCYNIEDVRQLARRRLPKGLFEFIDRATEDDAALRRNRAAFERVSIAPRMLVDVTARSTQTQLFGKPLSMPVAVAPCGPAGFFWHEGELALARAAAASDVPFTLTTYSTVPMERIVESGANVWLQLYLWNDRTISHGLVERAKSLGIRTLMVTVDTAVLGQREYLHHNGFLPPFKASPRAMLDMLMHPRWLAGVPLRYLSARAWPRVVNVPEDLAGGDANPRVGLAQNLQWDDLARLRDLWHGEILVKGILRAEDAVLAVKYGCNGVVVSNHGGRNLDAACSALDALPSVVSAIGSRASVLMDSGIRRGSDIVKALALGAQGVLVGRAALYGVAAGGQAGAEHALGLLRSELDRNMALIGAARISEITADLIARPHAPL